MEPQLNYEYQEVILGEDYGKSALYELSKRFWDIILSTIGLIITSPIILIICLCVVIESKGKPIYKQERLGKDNKIFLIYKIRSMYIDAEKYCGPIWAAKDDYRITKIGKFIRRTRIDELPQLINIIKGEMSIVGPRPERPFLTYKFENDIPGFINRLVIRPGLTGSAQVNGGYDITPKEKLKLDLEYIELRNFLIDTKIIIKTVIVVLSGKGAR